MRPLVWFRADLRADDNTALHRACAEAQRGVAAVFLIASRQWRDHDWADAKVDFVRRTLVELRAELDRLNVPLLIERAATFHEAPAVLLHVARRLDCTAIHFNREYEVNESRRDGAVTQAFERAGLEVRAYHDQTVVPPEAIRTGSGGGYKVFAPYSRAWRRHLRAGVPEPAGRPRRQPELPAKPDDVPAGFEGFDPARGRPDLWPAGERAARRRLDAFVGERIARYAADRDRPAAAGTSRLSPYLTVGAISPRRCLAAAFEANARRLGERRRGPSTWISELVWREFYKQVLVGFPRVGMHRPMRLATDRLPWSDDRDRFAAWCEGRTGVPIVDAGMRQLAETGWMHNRLRMITAMYLAKDLFVDWRLGERHFMRHLVDGDQASNNGGWQWSASTGADAAPYFRVFNPYRQSRRFDPDGVFIRRWVPELRDLEGDAVHGEDEGPPGYPRPIVDHSEAASRAVKAFKALGEVESVR